MYLIQLIRIIRVVRVKVKVGKIIMINNNLIYSKEGYLKLIRKKVIVINTYKLFKQDLKE